MNKTIVSTSTPVCDTGIYASGDLIGGKLTLSNVLEMSGGGGVIHSVVVADKAKQNSALDIVIFDSDPSATTFTDQSALTIADADLLKIVGIIPIAATDYRSFADNSCADLKSVGLIVKGSATSTLYACVVSRGTPTYASASDLQLKIKILPD